MEEAQNWNTWMGVKLSHMSTPQYKGTWKCSLTYVQEAENNLGLDE